MATDGGCNQAIKDTLSPIWRKGHKAMYAIACAPKAQTPIEINFGLTSTCELSANPVDPPPSKLSALMTPCAISH